MAMLLSELLPEYQIPQDVWLDGICEDSRALAKGELFCARLGGTHDGKAYVQEAIAKGAVALLYESVPAEGGSNGVPLDVDLDVELGMEIAPAIPATAIEGLGQKLGLFASRFYGAPSAAVELVAVTGTNGKTSFAQMLAQALTALEVRCGTIGTLGYGLPGRLKKTELTTPGPILLQSMFREMVADEGCNTVVVEASSQGLAQHRLNGSDIDVAVFTNITHEHLDYHHTLANYQAAKHLLFEFNSLHAAVINVDDAWGRELAAELAAGLNVCRFSLQDTQAEVYCLSQQYHATGTALVIAMGDEQFRLQLPLWGSFNVQNLLAVVATLKVMAHPLQDIKHGVQSIMPVPGRMELISPATDGNALPGISSPGSSSPKIRSPRIIVDYAHTPDALEKCLVAIAAHFPECKICCVFGCGGDRDKTKRPMMGAIASQYADRLVLTDDNPRQEPSSQIINDIMAGVSTPEVELISDRKQAIQHAISTATADDLVLVAGRGHESYQALADGQIYFSDREVIQELLAGRSGESSSDENPDE